MRQVLGERFLSQNLYHRLTLYCARDARDTRCELPRSFVSIERISSSVGAALSGPRRTAAYINDVYARGSGVAFARRKASIKFSTIASGVKLSFVATNRGYADKDEAEEEDWGGSEAPPPPPAGQGGVALEAVDGRIVARRCDYQGGIIKQMSEDRIIAQLKTDVSAGFSSGS